MPVRILASSDLHLGKRSSGMDAFSEECSTKLAWKRMVDYAVQNAIDYVLLAGDVIDRNNRYYEAGTALRDGFSRLQAAGIVVYIVSGNHDYDVLPQVLRNHPFDNVHLLGVGGHWQSDKVQKNGQRLQFIGWSFPLQYVDASPVIGLANFETDPNYLRIGLLHTDIYNPESRYAPVSLPELQNSGVDIWMLGHIHKPANFPGSKIIRYPGSPQSLSAKEQGAHGALLLTINSPELIDIEELRFSNCRFECLTIDVSNVATEESTRGLIDTELSAHANGMLAELEHTVFLVYDLHLVGQSSKRHEILSWVNPAKENPDLTLATDTKVLIRSITADIRPVVENMEELAVETSPAGLLAQTILALRNDTSTPFLDELTRNWEIQFNSISSSGIYQPMQEEWQRNGNPRTAKDYILEQCNRLLSELLYPTN